MVDTTSMAVTRRNSMKMGHVINGNSDTSIFAATWQENIIDWRSKPGATTAGRSGPHVDGLQLLIG